MKALFILLCFSFPSICVSQNLAIKDEKELNKAIVQNSVTERPLGEYEKELEALRMSVRQTSKQALEIEKNIYTKNRVNLINSIELLNQLIVTVDLIETDKKHQKVGAILQQVSSPTSDILGFKFSDVINQAVEKRIAESVTVESEKKRIKGTFTNLIKGLGQSFPALNVVSSVISIFSSIIQPKIEKVQVSIDRRSDKVISSYDETSLVFSSEQMDKFTADLAPYISFYQTLDKQSNNFEKSIGDHSYRYREFLNEIKNVNNLVLSTYGKEAKEIDYETCNSLFAYPNTSTFEEYKNINSSDKIRISPKVVVSICDLMSDFYEYYYEYSLIIDSNISNSLIVLESGKKLPGAQEAAITTKITEINDLWKGTISGSTESPGFRNKFGIIMSKTKTYYSKIERY